MKSYRHKLSGKIATDAGTISDGIKQYSIIGENSRIPEWALGSDWIEMKARENPVVTLRGEDMYEGDTLFMVHSDTFRLSKDTLWKQWVATPNFVYFSNKRLAEKYIYENKPIYPAALMDELICLGLMCDFNNTEINDDNRINTLLKKLRSFKP